MDAPASSDGSSSDCANSSLAEVTVAAASHRKDRHGSDAQIGKLQREGDQPLLGAVMQVRSIRRRSASPAEMTRSRDACTSAS